MLRESQNTQSSRLRLGAFLADDGDQECNFTELEIRLR
jgi:hypothetical protein